MNLIRVRLGTKLRRIVDEEDIFQECCLNALRSIRKFQPIDQSSLDRWLGSIVENIILNIARSAPRGLPFTECPDLGGRAMKPEDLPDLRGTPVAKAPEREERFERLLKALEELSDDHREVIILSRVRRLSGEEIASRMNRSPEAVYMLLLRALRRLRTIFGHTDSFGLPARSILDPPPGLNEANAAPNKAEAGGPNESDPRAVKGVKEMGEIQGVPGPEEPGARGSEPPGR